MCKGREVEGPYFMFALSTSCPAASSHLDGARHRHIPKRKPSMAYDHVINRGCTNRLDPIISCSPYIRLSLHLAHHQEKYKFSTTTPHAARLAILRAHPLSPCLHLPLSLRPADRRSCPCFPLSLPSSSAVQHSPATCARALTTLPFLIRFLGASANLRLCSVVSHSCWSLLIPTFSHNWDFPCYLPLLPPILKLTPRCIPV